MAEQLSTDVPAARPQVSLERSKSVPMDSPYGLGNLLMPVMLFYHPSMEDLANKITSEVENRKLKDKTISVIINFLCV